MSSFTIYLSRRQSSSVPTVQKTEEFETNPMYDALKLNICQLIEEMVTICKAQEYAAEYFNGEYDLNEFMIQVVKHLNQLSIFPQYTKLMTEASVPLVNDVILPLLVTTSEDLDTFISDPSEFNNYYTDICYQQNSDTLKSCIMKLLDNVCLVVDSANSLVLHEMVYLIDYCLSSKTEEKMASYENLKQLSECRFGEMKKEEQLEIALLVLADMSAVIISRPKMM